MTQLPNMVTSITLWAAIPKRPGRLAGGLYLRPVALAVIRKVMACTSSPTGLCLHQAGGAVCPH